MTLQLDHYDFFNTLFFQGPRGPKGIKGEPSRVAGKAGRSGFPGPKVRI